jgi:hypothetical protein
MSAQFAKLTEKEVVRILDWSMRSACFKVLKLIRAPDVWPIETKTSWKHWGFKLDKIKGDKVYYEFYNDATVEEQRAARGASPLQSGGGGIEYTRYVYAKGDGQRRKPIAPGIVKGAIAEVEPSMEADFSTRIDKFLVKRGR